MDRRVLTVGSLILDNMIKQGISQRETEKNKIVVLQNGKQTEFEAEKGKKLLDAALDQGKTLEYKCRKGTCGQCSLKVVQAPQLSEPNEKEQGKLKRLLTSGFRLACQADIL